MDRTSIVRADNIVLMHLAHSVCTSSPSNCWVARHDIVFHSSPYHFLKYNYICTKSPMTPKLWGLRLGLCRSLCRNPSLSLEAWLSMFVTTMVVAYVSPLQAFLEMRNGLLQVAHDSWGCDVESLIPWIVIGSKWSYVMLNDNPSTLEDYWES